MAVNIYIPRIQGRPLGQSKYSSKATANSFGAGEAVVMADMGNGLLSGSRGLLSTAGRKKNELEAEQKRLERERETNVKKARSDLEKAANREATYNRAAFQSSIAVNDVEQLFDNALDIDVDDTDIDGDNAGVGLGYVDSSYAFAGTGFTSGSGMEESELDQLHHNFRFDGYKPNEESEKIRNAYIEDMTNFKSTLAHSGMKPTDQQKEFKARAEAWSRAIKVHNNNLRKREKATHLANLNNSYAKAGNNLKEAIGRIGTDGAEDIGSILENMVDFKKSQLFLDGSINSVDKNGNPTDLDALARRSASQYVEGIIADHIKQGDIIGANKIFNSSVEHLDDDARHDIALSLTEETQKLQSERVIKSIGKDLYLALNSGDPDLKKRAIDDYELQSLEAQSKIDAYVDRLQEVDKEETERISKAAEEHFQAGIREGRVEVKYTDLQTGRVKYYDAKKKKEARDLLYTLKTNTHSAAGDDLFIEISRMKGDPERLAKVDLNDQRLHLLTQEQWDTVNKEVTGARDTVKKFNDEAVAFYTNKKNKPELDTIFSDQEVNVLEENRAEVVKAAIQDIRAKGTGVVDLPSVKLWINQEYVFKYPYKTIETRRQTDAEVGDEIYNATRLPGQRVKISPEARKLVGFGDYFDVVPYDQAQVRHDMIEEPYSIKTAGHSTRSTSIARTAPKARKGRMLRTVK